jgi:hypothetical protein
MNDATPIRIQILAAKEGTGSAGRAVAAAHDRLQDIAEIGRRLGAEALLVCPAPELDGDTLDLIVAARFDRELDEDTVFWRQRDLCSEIHHALKAEAIVLDLDGPLGFLKHIEPMLVSPYQDEIGRRTAGV